MKHMKQICRESVVIPSCSSKSISSECFGRLIQTRGSAPEVDLKEGNKRGGRTIAHDVNLSSLRRDNFIEI